MGTPLVVIGRVVMLGAWSLLALLSNSNKVASFAHLDLDRSSTIAATLPATAVSSAAAGRVEYTSQGPVARVVPIKLFM